jgi:adenylate cyclase
MIKPADILNARILIVDDLEANVILLEEMLKAAGYTSVRSTQQPERVCELHLEHAFDLIILDLNMPVMDGFTVMENLKTLEPGSYIPVLVVTAQSDHKLRALRAGARDFISKPFELAEVLVRVRNLIEVRLLHRRSVELIARVVAEKAVSRRLLLDLLPLARPVEPEGPASENWAEVAVLFLDLLEFTALSERAEAAALIGVLDEISGRHDTGRAFERERTVGGAYLATTGLSDTLAFSTLDATEKALDLAEALDRFNDHNPFKLKVRLTIGGRTAKL